MLLMMYIDLYIWAKSDSESVCSVQMLLLQPRRPQRPLELNTEISSPTLICQTEAEPHFFSCPLAVQPSTFRSEPE